MKKYLTSEREPYLQEKVNTLKATECPQFLGSFDSCDTALRFLAQSRDFRLFMVLFSKPDFVLSDLNTFQVYTEDDSNLFRMFKKIVSAIDLVIREKTGKSNFKDASILLDKSSAFHSGRELCRMDSSFFLPRFPTGMSKTQIFAQACMVANSKRSDVYERLPQSEKKITGYIPVIEWFVYTGEVLQLNSYAGRKKFYDDDPKTLKKAIISKDIPLAARYIRSYVHLPEKTRNNLRAIVKADYVGYANNVKPHDRKYLQAFTVGMPKP